MSPGGRLLRFPVLESDHSPPRRCAVYLLRESYKVLSSTGEPWTRRRRERLSSDSYRRGRPVCLASRTDNMRLSPKQRQRWFTQRLLATMLAGCGEATQLSVAPPLGPSRRTRPVGASTPSASVTETSVSQLRKPPNLTVSIQRLDRNTSSRAAVRVTSEGARTEKFDALASRSVGRRDRPSPNSPENRVTADLQGPHVGRP